MLRRIDISSAENESSRYAELNNSSDSRQDRIGAVKGEEVGCIDEGGCEERDARAEYFARPYSNRESTDAIYAVAANIRNIF